MGPRRGDEVGGYNITNSVEVGYRFVDAAGSVERYRSDVNFGNGVRVLSSQLAAYAREGKGSLFDSLTFTTLGLGNDPYEMATLRAEKNHLYRYDLLWRQTDFFNPAVAVAGGFHRMDTTRGVQDHDVTLGPGTKYRVLLGYSRNRQSGPALSTINAFDSRGERVPVVQRCAAGGERIPAGRGGGCAGHADLRAAGVGFLQGRHVADAGWAGDQRGRDDDADRVPAGGAVSRGRLRTGGYT